MIRKSISSWSNIVKIAEADDRVWLKLDSSLLKLEVPVYIGAWYIPPKGSTGESNLVNKWSLLAEEVAHFKARGQLLLLGDFNARTADLSENSGCGVRISKDNSVNDYGKELLQICHAYNLTILNGRVGVGNQLDSFTCITSQGCSVVDYAIVSETLLTKIGSFQVDNPSTYSDHCSLSVSIGNTAKSPSEIVLTESNLLLEDIQHRDQHTVRDHTQCTATKYKVVEDNVDTFTQRLQSAEWKKELLSIEGDVDITSQIKHFQSGILSLALDSGLLCQLSPNSTVIKKKKNTNQPWHDQQCYQAKSIWREAMKNWKNSKRDTHLLQTMLQNKRKYKSLCRTKKRKHNETFSKTILELQTRNPKVFWRKVKGEKKVAQTNIEMKDWFDYFKDLHTCENSDKDSSSDVTRHTPSHSHTQDMHRESQEELDGPITLNEVQSAVQNLDKDKSPGEDGIMPILLKSLNETSLQTITKCFNNILNEGEFPDCWGNGVVIPIPKTEQASLPSQYRGITLLPILSKLFTAILATRIRDWAERHQKLGDYQFGFRQGCQTVDAIFIVQTLFERSKVTKSSLFCCFVDFRKAFDSINHNKLWSKLSSLGISRKLINIMSNMYSKATASVRMGNETSPSFECNIGLRQGCPLSPTLFSLYISDLIPQLASRNEGALIFRERINGLLFADDVALLAETAENMEGMLDTLHEYCSRWGLQLNTQKTKMMKSPWSSNESKFHYNLTEIEEVEEYKYLGFHINNRGDINQSMQVLLESGNKALHSLYSCSRRLGGLSVSTMCYLFTSLVEPVILYTCEIWGAKENETLEKFLRKFGKHILRVPQSCTTAAVLGELGIEPLYIRTATRSFKFFQRLNSDLAPKLSVEALKLSKCLGKHSLYDKVSDRLHKSGLSFAVLEPMMMSATTLKHRLSDIFIQQWRVEVESTAGKSRNEGGNKLRFYKLVKDNFAREKYLDILPNRDRVNLTRLRVSAHKLQIELGRYNNPPTPVALRKCSSCDVIEDETHFLLRCKKFEVHRKEMFDSIRKASPIPKSDHGKIRLLLCSSNQSILSALCKFLHYSYSLLV